MPPSRVIRARSSVSISRHACAQCSSWRPSGRPSAPRSLSSLPDVVLVVHQWYPGLPDPYNAARWRQSRDGGGGTLRLYRCLRLASGVPPQAPIRVRSRPTPSVRRQHRDWLLPDQRTGSGDLVPALHQPVGQQIAPVRHAGHCLRPSKGRVAPARLGFQPRRELGGNNQ